MLVHTAVTIPSLSFQVDLTSSSGSPLTLSQMAAKYNVGSWCLLAANPSGTFNGGRASWPGATQVTVPVCLHTDNITAMSTIEAYSFMNSGPSDWDWDHDLITRMGMRCDGSTSS